MNEFSLKNKKEVFDYLLKDFFSFSIFFGGEYE